MSSIASSVPDQLHTRFIAAAAQGNEALLRDIFSEGLNWTSAMDRTVLRQALQKVAAKGILPIVRLLLEWGAEVNPHRDNVSPLFKAVEGRHPLVAKELLERGASPDWRRPRDGLSALFIACLHGLNSVVKALLAAGADPNARDREGRTPLLFAATEKSGKCNGETFRMLLEKGADIEARDQIGRTALLWAAASGNMRTVEIFLSGELGKRADVSAGNNRGTTALYFAAEKNHEEMVRYLLTQGADPRTITDGGWTALHTAARNGHAGVVYLLLQAGAAINSQLSNGMTPLHWAAMNGHTELVELLLANPEINSDIKDSFNRTPMLCAAERYHRDIALLLSPNRAGDRLSPVAQGACRGFQATVVDFGNFRDSKKQLVLKHSVYSLLYGWDNETNKPTIPISPKNVKHQPVFRWIHLPANNTLLAKSLAEGGYQDLESFKALDECFDQEQHGPLAHDHSMRPFCERIVPPRSDSAGRGSVPVQSPDRSETGQRDSRSKAEVIAERHAKRPTRSRRDGHARMDEPLKDVTPGNIVLFMPFLHYETVEQREKMDNAIKSVRMGEHLSGNPSPDLLLVNGYLNRERPLHIRRTLDQYFYSGIDTSARDMDQVVSRYCKRHHLQGRMLMVDQLWLWVIGKDLVITCFAERWEQPKTDPLNVLDSIIEGINGEQIVASAYHLAMLIFNYCCNIFDRPRVDQAYQFLDMFESSIGLIINRQTQLLRSFYRVSELSTRWLQDRQRRQGQSGRMPSSPGEHDYVLDALLELGEESAMLNEINDIRDELNVIEVILGSQTAILETFESLVTEELRESGGKRPAIDDLVGQLRKRWREQKRRIETRHRDLERMDRRAENAYTSLRSLLELKQMQSNALEAKFARDQAVTASKQGQAILVFTIVTIVFLPMSFVASLFTINIDVWGDPLPLPYVAKYTFGIGLGISIPLIVMALTVTDIITALKWFLVGAKNRLLCGWASPEDEGLEGTAGEKMVTYAPKGGDLFPEKRWRQPSPYPPTKSGYNKYREESTDGMPTALGGKSKSRRLFRGNGNSVSWVRRTMDRGRAGRSDDPESGRSIS
ncbi:hypothetical protein DL765_005493 [Monosporascus sp. GIB2]|nr:hypothetical protein DL765_005493 [Monosporascus sp. GIB2]